MMNCNEFKNRLADAFDSKPDPQFLAIMQEHMALCKSCTKEYNSYKKLLKMIEPEVPFSLPDSGLKQKILNQIKKEETEMESTQQKKFTLKVWQKRAIAVAAGIALIVTVFMVSNRSPLVSTTQAAEHIMLKSITAMESLRSMFITMDVRSLKNENFDLIGTEYDFIEYKFWKQFSGYQPWRIEKPGRIVTYDGQKQFLYIPELSYAITGSKDDGFVEWMKLFFEPKEILEWELAFSEKYDAEFQIEKTEDEIILTVQANALGDFHNNFRKNTSILESDNTRRYTFDKKTDLLKTFMLFINKNGESVKVIDLKNIAYNIPIPATTFTIELPKEVIWQENTDPGFVKAFTKISSKEAAKKFFTALSSEDYMLITPVWDALQISDQEVIIELKSYYGGLELISLGEAFKSGLYPGEFIPYTIKLKSGKVKEFNLALRNDNPTKTWIIDGGI